MRTDEKLTELCEALQYNGGDIHAAARRCGVSPAFVHSWIKDDKVAADQIQEAQRVGYGGLESEAIRRAIVGVEEDIYYRGEVVGQKTVYSDGLLSKVMEARIPEYSKKEGATNSLLIGTQINIMPRANSYEEWLTMRDSTIEHKEVLAIEKQVQDADFTPVDERPLASLEGLI